MKFSTLTLLLLPFLPLFPATKAFKVPFRFPSSIGSQTPLSDALPAPPHQNNSPDNTLLPSHLTLPVCPETFILEKIKCSPPSASEIEKVEQTTVGGKEVQECTQPEIEVLEKSIEKENGHNAEREAHVQGVREGNPNGALPETEALRNVDLSTSQKMHKRRQGRARLDSMWEEPNIETPSNLFVLSGGPAKDRDLSQSFSDIDSAQRLADVTEDPSNEAALLQRPQKNHQRRQQSAGDEAPGITPGDEDAKGTGRCGQGLKWEEDGCKPDVEAGCPSGSSREKDLCVSSWEETEFDEDSNVQILGSGPAKGWSEETTGTWQGTSNNTRRAGGAASAEDASAGDASDGEASDGEASDGEASDGESQGRSHGGGSGPPASTGGACKNMIPIMWAIVVALFMLAFGLLTEIVMALVWFCRWLTPRWRMNGTL